jgi:Protein of unknown function (DUF2934)
MPNMEETIRERAYHLWIADGSPEGKPDVYWLYAQQQILAALVEGPTAAVDPVATKPARRARTARSDKAKSRAA